MATDATERTLEEATSELLEVLRDVERAVRPPDPGQLIRPPTPRGLLEFTTEVGIPAAILVLRTNIAALELLQRSLRMMGDGQPDRETPVRDRAADLTATSLARLDDALTDLGTAVDARAVDRSPDELLAEARRRTERLQTQLSDRDAGDAEPRPGSTVDVEAELESLRRSVDAGADADATGEDDGTDADDRSES